MPRAPDDASERVLIFALFGGDAVHTRGILLEAGISAVVCPDLEALASGIAAGAGAVVLAEEALVPAAAQRLLAVLEREPPWSDLPIIVSTAERETAREGYGVVDALGARANIQLLERPVRIRTMVTAVRAALRARRRQYEARGLLRRLVESEARFRRVQEASPHALMLFRPVFEGTSIVDFEWVYANPTAERLVERALATLVGTRLAKDPVIERLGGHITAFARAYEVNAVHHREYFLGEDGTARAFRQTIFRLDGQLAVMSEDVTERKRAEVERASLLELEREARERAEATNRGKDEFLAMVSHELRTPLNAMLGWAHMLNAGHLEGNRAVRALEAIERNAVAQAQLIEDLLDISRIEAGKVRLDLAQVALQRVVEAAVDAVRPAMDAKDLRFVQRMDKRLPLVMGDASRLQQVVWNLLSNAIKFTPSGRSIELTVRMVGANLEVSVKDEGQGIEPSFLPYLFQRFQQADSSITRAHGGLGLGLSISRHLVELHGGTIDAESAGPGKGAVFRFQLPPLSACPVPVPLRPRVRDVAHNRRKDDRPPELSGLKVLVVDDDADSRELLATVLTDCGARPVPVATAQQALRAVSQERPDVILSDIGMPGEDGYELIRRVRALTPADGGLIPAAAISAYARADNRRRAMKAGYELHVAKPFEPAEIVTAVATLARIGGVVKPAP